MLLDVVIDPLTVRGDRWFLGRIYYYPDGGIHFGVPLSNYAGWFVVAVAAIAVLQTIERRAGWSAAGARHVPYAGLLEPALYLGIVAFNLAITAWIGERLLALVGALLYAPVVVLFLAHPLNPMRRVATADVARHASVALVAVLLVCAVAWPAAALTGREVIDTAQRTNGFSTWHDRTLETTMETYTTSLERTREATVSEQTAPRGEHRTFMEFTAPSDVTGTLFLHLSPRGEKDQQWVWTPAARKARRLADASRDENFFGTDLSYRDLELLVRIQQWNDAESTATLDADEAIDGKPCHVVGLVPKNDEFPYSRYRLWFGTDDSLLWQVEVYDVDGKLFKRVRMREYERIQGYATAKESEIANVQYGTHTVFRLRNVRYDSGIPDDTFAVSNVQKGR
jgi:outer membrane lipoprotein-sorting protein